MEQLIRRRVRQSVLALCALLMIIFAPLLSTAAPLAAVLPVLPTSTQFDVTGFLQSATVDNPTDAHSGGTMMINGHTIIVPRETIVILPASALTWQELFSQAPAPYAPTQTGMALKDLPKPLTTYEFQAVGNRVIDANGTNGCAVAAGCDRYIAGLVHVSQQDLNAGAGYINFINYATGEMLVGGALGSSTTGTRLRINDPANLTSASGGRYGRAMTPDVRFQVDQDNPTILSATGFPMCFPRVTADPNAAGNADDPLCPLTNRPISTGVADTLGSHPPAGQFDSLFRMSAPIGAVVASPPAPLDPRVQAPMEVGDYVNFAGTLIQDGGANGGYYISAHTIVNNTAIYTQPGIDPAYVSIEVALIGTGGLTVFGAGEAAVRTRFEGMTTDETRGIHLYGIDINPADGSTSDRDWGTILPDPGPPNGAVRGRWRFRPPCTATIATDKKCVMNASGTFLPPTREVRAVVEGLQQFLPGTHTANSASQVPGTPSAVTSANGIYYGQYHAPIGEYIFPENVPGNPIPENNFNTIDFLAYGGYQSITGVQAGVLNPWPSNIPAPVRTCVVPTINGGPYSVANGGSIQLSGSVNANATSPVILSWIAGTTAGGTNLNGALINASTTSPTFNATGLAVGTYFLTFTASNVCGQASAATTITVQAAPPPTISPIQNQTVTLGAQVTVVASSNSLPTPTWTWTQTGGPGFPPAIAFTQTPAAATPSANSTLRFNPAAAGIYTFSVTATNVNGTSPATLVSITVTASVPTNIVLTPVEYRTSKQRLVITATTTDLTVTSMVLQPYLTENGTMFDPATLGASQFTNTGGGIWTITGAVGASKPACNLGGAYATPCSQRPITVKAFSGAVVTGTSAPTALDRIRQ